MPEPRIESRTVLAAGKFLELARLDWRDDAGRARSWETADRVGAVQAVLIVPILRPSGRVVLVRQYRPPLGAPTVEFPAGLVDEGETPAETALRELREETGYFGVLRSIGEATCTSPGMTGEGVHLAHVEIDETLPANQHPESRPEPDESIEVLAVALGELGEFVRRESARGVRFDSKIAAFLLGQEVFRP